MSHKSVLFLNSTVFFRRLLRFFLIYLSVWLMVYEFRAKNHRVKLWSFRCHFIHIKYHWHLSFHEHSMYICSSVASREMHANLNECSLLYERAPLFLAKRAKVIKVTWTLFFAFYCNTSTITEHTKPNLFIQTIQFCSISLLYVCTLSLCCVCL